MQSYIEILDLKGHIEGGYFGEFYKSQDNVEILDERYTEKSQQLHAKENIKRQAGSSIYFLLEKHAFSAWHRLKSDEVWHYYDGGSPIDIHVIEPDGKFKTYVLGHPSMAENALFQIAIKAGVWFAAEVRNKSSFGLVGCTVSPAFEYSDFELAEPKRDELVKCYPNLTKIIDKFIKPNVPQINQEIHNHIISSRKNNLTAQDYIQQFNLEKHREGGYFIVNYVAKDKILPLHDRYQTDSEKNAEKLRSAGSAIYFLLDKHDFSAWHQLKSDEIWHYYDGTAIDIHVIDKDGKLDKRTLGNPLQTENANFQVVIKAGEWFAAELCNKDSFGFIGCTVAPGFEYKDFELGKESDLISLYPEHQLIIKKLSRSVPEKSWTNKALSYGVIALVSGMGLYTLFNGNENVNSCINTVKSKMGI